MKAGILVAEACRFYGWTVEYVLAMPARTFFAMTEAMRTLEAYERIEQVDIAAIPMATGEWYKKVRAKYTGYLESLQVLPGLPPALQPPPPMNRALDGEDARQFMFGLFATKKAYG